MPRDFDIVVRIADRQHGRVGAAQAVAAGVHPQALPRWHESGIVHREYPSVYAIGHRAPSLLGELMAAVLAGAPDGLAGYASCAHVRGVIGVLPARPEIIVPYSGPREIDGILFHRARTIPHLDRQVWHGIPMTTIPRALLDLAPRLTVPELTRAWHEAYVKHGITPKMIEACMRRHPRRPGLRKLRRALGSDVTLSMLEDAFLDLLRRYGIPLPRTNIDVRGHKVDCHWPELGLTIELLGYRFHASRQAFERDVARQRRTGHVAFTWGDVTERGDATATEVLALIVSRSRV